MQSDKVLSSILPVKPNFTYRKAPSLRNRLVHNTLDPPKQIKLFKNLKCGKCLPCRVSKKTNKKKTSFTSAANGSEYNIKELITCNSTHVTYIIECPCHKQYVGRTTSQLCVRIREHISNIKNGFNKHRFSRHFRDYHGRPNLYDLLCHWQNQKGIVEVKIKESRCHKMKPNGFFN